MRPNVVPIEEVETEAYRKTGCAAMAASLDPHACSIFNELNHYLILIETLTGLVSLPAVHLAAPSLHRHNELVADTPMQSLLQSRETAEVL